MKFEMKPLEVERANAWIKSQQDKTKNNLDATGFRFGIVFCPTSLGDCVKVYDFNTKEFFDVTDLDW